MSKDSAPKKTPLKKGGNNSTKSSTRRTAGLTFIVAAVDMSWKLAAVVLVPIVGGFWLDSKLDITPILTIVGFILAMLGVFMVLKQTIVMADKRFNNKLDEINTKEKK